MIVCLAFSHNAVTLSKCLNTRPSSWLHSTSADMGRVKSKTSVRSRAFHSSAFPCTRDGGMTFYEKRYFTTHVNNSHSPKVFLCPHSGFSAAYAKQHQLGKHLDSLVHNPQSFLCPHPDCPATYDMKQKLNRHLKRKHRPKEIPCSADGCPALFTSNEYLCRHLRQVHGPKDVCCPHEGCDAKFGIKNDLDQHLRNNHQPKVANPKRFTCPLVFCQKSFTQSSDLKRHQKTLHVPNVIVPPTYPCSYEGCGLSFARIDYLMSHVTHIHQPHIRCPHCPRKFGTKASVDLHVLYMHTVERRFVCEKCDYPFKKLGDLNVHSIGCAGPSSETVLVYYPPRGFKSVEDRLAFRSAEAGLLDRLTPKENALNPFRKKRVQFGGLSAEDMAKAAIAAFYYDFTLQVGDLKTKEMFHWITRDCSKIFPRLCLGREARAWIFVCDHVQAN